MIGVQTHHRPMPARETPRGAASPRVEPAPSAEENLLAPEADPDEVVETILALLSEERFQSARRLAAAAVSRFPDHRRVGNAWRIFENRGTAIRRPATEPDRKEELAWLRNPPAAARGKWVALVGAQLVAAADTLPALMEALAPRQLPKPALVHRVD